MKQVAKTEAPNIILITIDALRYDHLRRYGYQKMTWGSSVFLEALVWLRQSRPRLPGEPALARQQAATKPT